MPGFELIGEEEKQAVAEVFDKGGVLYRYGLNAKRQNIFRVDEFEKKIAQKVGSKYALYVCNGTAALKLALIALGVKSGDEVITQSFTFIATVEAILELGAIPVITEVDKSLNMDPLDLEKKITAKTKVIIPVHMAGVAAKMKEILAIAKKHKISVLEDSAQALGATYQGKFLGTIAQAGIYSLDIGKVITTGEGGILVTDDEKIYLKAREYSDHGHECNPNLPRGEDTRSIWGFNYKVTELQGAVGLAQLKKLDFILKKQKDNKRQIKEEISNISSIEFREIPNPDGDAADTLIFFIDSKERAKSFAKKLAERGIGTKNLPDAINWHFAGTWGHIFYICPKYKGKDLEKVWNQSTNYLRRAVALPIMVNMSQEQIKKIIQAVKEIFQEV
ncbi:MAG: DegT/DnrJ/EryC1/StrS family aminotransferase [Candidatus Omnitrophica bacterium]|jgi:8-amino-3,8-dideoxy-alpha-D-manno-octulosonate transaminase|nr:DegT/DnrJ/EryC1/StrS family aminotransferase [Candidatus Omnitrophota bacterium]